MLFLEEFWYGNISPGEERCRPNSEYSKVFREMEASSLSDCDSFISGFRLGAKVIMDVLLPPLGSQVSSKTQKF